MPDWASPPLVVSQRLYDNIYAGLWRGGALLLVEKVLGSGSSIDGILVEEYYKEKLQKGYSEEQIESKRNALSRSLVPVTDKQNELFLRDAGFDFIDRYWRYLNFVGYLAIKR